MEGKTISPEALEWIKRYFKGTMTGDAVRKKIFKLYNIGGSNDKK